MIDWLLISIAILFLSIVVGILIIVLIWTKKKETYKESNYHFFSIAGILLLFIGLGLMIISLLFDYSFIAPVPIFMIGIVYLVIGSSCKDTFK